MTENTKTLQILAKDIKLLYVEDEESVRKSVRDTLAYFFNYIDVASNGEEGLELYKKSKYDLVISDIRMPKMDGIELTKAIKEINKEQFIMIVSAHDESNYLIQLVNLGVHSFVSKPIDVDILIDMLVPLCKIINEKNELELYRIQQIRFNAIRELLSNIAHQWRQPLNVLAANLQNMEMLHEFDQLSEEQIHQSIKKSMKLITQMSAVIDSFRGAFDNSTIEEDISIQKSVESALKIITDMLEAKDIVVKVDIKTDSIIKGRPNEFNEVLLHIINNAIDAFEKNSIKNPYILIAAHKNDRTAELSISDNAGGIDETTLQSVYEPYSTTKFKSSGIGMGLFIAKTTIVHHMQGNLELKNVDEGVKCTITLPLKQKDLMH